jgi:hypothetical protein
MADDPKKNDDEKPAGEGEDKLAKKPYTGESKESVTKIERRRTESSPPKSDPPKSGDDDASIEKAAAKAAESAKSEDDEPTAKPPSVKPVAKKPADEDDDEPTGAQTPIAKSVKEPDKKPSAAAAKKVEVAEEEDDEDEEDEVPVRRPGAKTATTTKAAAAKTAPRKAGGGGGGAGGGGGRPTGGEGEGKRRRASAESGGLILLLAGFLVVGNMALKGVASTRLDATKDERYSLSKKGTAHLLSTLKKPLNIKVFAPEGLATIDAFVRDLRDLLSEYVRYGQGKVTYEVVVPDRLEGEAKTKAEAEAQEAGLHKQILGEGKGTGAKQATIGEGYLGMILTYGGEKATIDQQEGLDERNPTGLEFLISNKIRELRDKEDKISHRIGYLQGHKEHGFQELSQVFGRYFPYYKFEAVDLSKGDKEVDASLDGLIVTQPEEEIPQKELLRINAFLMKGKAVAVFANPLHTKENDTAMNTVFAGYGIDKLLSGYGIDFKNELVVDQNQFWTPVFQGPNGIGFALDPYPLIFMADSSRGETSYDIKFAPFFRLPQIAVPFPLEMTVDKARAGGDAVKISPVLRMSPNVASVQGTTVSMHPARGRLWTGSTGHKEAGRKKGDEPILGVDLEGPIKSAFPAGGEGVDPGPTQAPNEARLFVLSSGYFFGNPFQDAGKSPFGQMMPGMDPNMGADEELMRYANIYQRARMPSLLVAKQTCDWISQETDLLAVGAKLLAEPELTYPNSPAPTPGVDEKMDSDSYKNKKQQWVDQIKSEQRTTQYACMFGSGVLLAAFGIFRAYQRNAARANAKI